MTFSEQDIRRMRQLWRAGFSLSTIARVFNTEPQVVHYHVRMNSKGSLVDFIKALLPHLPTEGPPLPEGYSLTWVEQSKLKEERK